MQYNRVSDIPGIPFIFYKQQILMEQNEIARYSTLDDYEKFKPVTVVWELTLACNLHCKHCGSRAGKARPDELSTEECFAIIEQLKKLGTREIGIIGGEVFMKKDWLKIIEKITLEGIDCNMQTGGFNLSEEKIVAAKNAGIKNIGLSIDGLTDTHNYTRGRSTSYQQALNCLSLLKKHGITSSVNTTITSINKHQLGEMLDVFISHGVKNWQLQFAVAMGNAVENEDLLIQPFETKTIIDSIADLYVKALANDLVIQPGNNIGYFGPHEHKWRAGNFGHYVGCSAGHTAMGIEADGTIKGCPSLPTTDYSGGNVRNMSLQDIWRNSKEIAFTRNRNENDLWGFCKSCYYSSVCQGGCTWTSHVLFGKRGNNPYCYHRVDELEKQGKREKLRKVKQAGGVPFDYGLFEIIVEDDKGEIIEIQQSDCNHQIEKAEAGTYRQITQLTLCKGCSRYVYSDTTVCPFCQSDIQQMEKEYNANMQEADAALEKVLNLMNSD
jgi:radical SAM protein with 4Fe4S-binding SPASM domain